MKSYKIFIIITPKFRTEDQQFLIKNYFYPRFSKHSDSFRRSRLVTDRWVSRLLRKRLVAV